jgi:very-long-chain (3R)-3-hydroxyacyl-CoA dehydratase
MARGVIKAWLVAYNLLAAAGWVLTLASLVQFILDHNTFQGAELYAAIRIPLQISQSAAMLEVVHASLRFVKADPFTTAIQVASRLFVLWFVVIPFPEVQQSWKLTLMVVSWSLSEIPRYPFYVVNLLTDQVPFLMKFFRYSGFLLLYPTGIAGELLCIFQALPEIRRTNPWSIYMPNAYNVEFSFYWFMWLVIAVYLPGSPFMYLHMMKQRNKALKPKDSASNKKAKPE